MRFHFLIVSLSAVILAALIVLGLYAVDGARRQRQAEDREGQAVYWEQKPQIEKLKTQRAKIVRLAGRDWRRK